MRTSINISMAIKKLVGRFYRKSSRKPRDQSEVMSLGSSLSHHTKWWLASNMVAKRTSRM